jgi:hypothetical protein
LLIEIAVGHVVYLLELIVSNKTFDYSFSPHLRIILGQDSEGADDQLGMRNMSDYSVKVTSKVSHKISALLSKVAFIEGVDELRLRTELRVDVRILKKEALVQASEELVEQVLSHVHGHIGSLQGRFLNIAP